MPVCLTRKGLAVADEYDDEEKELIAQHRAERERKRKEAEKGETVTISHGELSFTGPMDRAREVASAWGFKLAPEKPDPDEEASKGTRFGGRRVS